MSSSIMPVTRIHSTSRRSVDSESTGTSMPAVIFHVTPAARRAGSRRLPEAPRQSPKEEQSPSQRLSGMSLSTATRNVRTPRQATQTSKEASCSSFVLTYHFPLDAWPRVTVRASSRMQKPGKTERGQTAIHAIMDYACGVGTLWKRICVASAKLFNADRAVIANKDPWLA